MSGRALLQERVLIVFDISSSGSKKTLATCINFRYHCVSLFKFSIRFCSKS